jgi:hypothetical protein
VVRNTIPKEQTPVKPSVAVIVTSSDQTSLLAQALESCTQQTVRPAEILLVVNRLDSKAERVVAAFPGVAIYRQHNPGRADVKSAVLARVFSDFVIFLDGADRLTPSAIEAGLDCFNTNPDAWLVCGAHRVINAAGRPVSALWRERLGLHHSNTLSPGTLAVIQAAIMHRTDRLRSVGGPDANHKSREGYDNYFQSGRIATHDCCVAEYQYDKGLMLARSIIGLNADKTHGPDRDATAERRHGLLFHHTAPQVFATAARELINDGWNLESAKMMIRAAKMAPLTLVRAIISRGVAAIMRRLPRPIGRLFGEALWAPSVGNVRFGDFARVKPISADYGSDRGTPLDRYYIEQSLEQHSGLVRGRILEVGGQNYTRRFGADKVVWSDVLDINPLNPLATIVGDLGVLGALPECTFDCIILTQTLQLIYNLDNAMENLYRALAPGGALLITVPGISPIGPEELRYWYWSFSELSLKILLSSRFGESNLQVQSYGNVFAAICFLTGLCLPEVGTERLDYKDESYPITIFACARKPS